LATLIFTGRQCNIKVQDAIEEEESVNASGSGLNTESVDERESVDKRHSVSEPESAEGQVAGNNQPGEEGASVIDVAALVDAFSAEVEGIGEEPGSVNPDMSSHLIDASMDDPDANADADAISEDSEMAIDAAGEMHPPAPSASAPQAPDMRLSPHTPPSEAPPMWETAPPPSSSQSNIDELSSH
jgi:hypothetical protein